MRTLLLAAAMLVAPATGRAAIVLSQAVIDIQPDARAAQDIEVLNDGDDVAYVVAEPSEIVAPGRADERRVAVDDPDKGGLLVTPQKIVLQPQERKLVRIASVGARGQSDRIWRVVIKPVAGSVSAPVSALKVLVGYDVLVILRPQAPAPRLVGSRDGNALTLVNTGNTNVELYGGRQCASPGATPGATPGAADCKTLPSRRLYPGASWTQTLPGGGAVDYRLSDGRPMPAQHF